MRTEWRKYAAMFGLILLGLLVISVVIGATAAPPIETVAPFAVMSECQVLDLTADGIPDVVACPGGSYQLVPFEGTSP